MNGRFSGCDHPRLRRKRTDARTHTAQGIQDTGIWGWKSTRAQVFTSGLDHRGHGGRGGSNSGCCRTVLEWRWASVLQARSDRVDFWLGKALAACYGVNLAGARFWGVGLLGCWSRPVVVPLPWPREKPGPLNTASHLTVRRGCEGRGSGVQPKAPRGGPIGARRVVLGALARHTIERQPGAGSRKPGAERQEPGAGSR